MRPDTASYVLGADALAFDLASTSGCIPHCSDADFPRLPRTAGYIGCPKVWLTIESRLAAGVPLPKGMLAERRRYTGALGVGLSRWWRGFPHGRHRKHEPIIEGDGEAKLSGPRKGKHPKDPEAVRMPR